ncbi:ribonuclease R [Robiginitomaculum antarcticum]|uniref:ribonuclease R n=1 Tax=Robiginitomaculum antarcticum TaxID=437507 RepID=UPI000368360A|nr:ribonuclease R [Robiginitomaculum antarcticum]
MDINRKDILKAIGEQPDRLGKREISKIIDASAEQRRELRMILRDMEQRGEIVKSDRRTYRLSGDVPEVTILHIDRIDDDGDMIGSPAAVKGNGKTPEFIVYEKTRGKEGAKLGVGGRALCRIDFNASPPRAEVIRVIGRAPQRQLGVIVQSGRGMRIKAVSKRERHEFVLATEDPKLKPKDLVLFETLPSGRKTSRSELKPARIVEVVGTIDDPKAASLISLHEHNIPLGFPEEAEEEAAAATIPKVGGARKDLRHLPLLTIDPEDAKDFDDAICAMPNENGKGFTAWVAIADVAAYVTPGSALDATAFKKGNSVYLPDRVEPMLPHALSSDMCSLRPNEDRACMAVRLSFANDGSLSGYKFERGLMRSRARLTYAQAQEVFEGREHEAAAEVVPELQALYAAYKALRASRERRGPLEIDMPERRVRIGDNGEVTAIEVRERFDAHKLVEEFMIQANVAAAKALTAEKADLVFRVHDEPSREKLQSLSDFLPVVKMKWALGEKATPTRFNKLLRAAKDRDLSEIVGMAVLRSQSQAIYSPDNGGHFGLTLSHYAHFTSPIRRYADLIVHRALIRAFNLGDDGLTDQEISRLQEISEHISTTERTAMAAERDATDRYIAAHLADRVGAKFGARITGVTGIGLFVALDDTGADGLVPIRNLGNEYFRFDDRARALIGERTGGTYNFGQRVVVELVEATPISGGMIFDMVTEPTPGKPGRGKRGGQRRRGEAKKGGGSKSPAGQSQPRKKTKKKTVPKHKRKQADAKKRSAGQERP